MFLFPTKNPERASSWVRAINRILYDAASGISCPSDEDFFRMFPRQIRPWTCKDRDRHSRVQERASCSSGRVGRPLRHPRRRREVAVVNSMLDELPTSSDKRLYICPCCKFSFAKVEEYVGHLEKTKVRIEAAVATVAIVEMRGARKL